MKIFKIKGQLVDKKTGQPLTNFRIEAWDKDMLIDDLLGSAVSNDAGRFIITFDKRYYQEIIFDRRPDIYFKIFMDDKLIVSTKQNILWNTMDPDKEIVIGVPIKDNDDIINNLVRITVKGTIRTDARGLPPTIKVQVVNRHVLDETVLACATPDINGRYKAAVSINIPEPPALMARAIDQQGNILAASATVFDIVNPLTLDIFIPGDNIQKAPEYTQIQESVKLCIGNKSAADLTREQLDLIAGKTRHLLTNLQYYQRAQQLSLSEGISGEILYALFRKGLPAGLSSLYEQSSLDLAGLIVEAVKENIITPQDEQEVAASLEKIQRHALNNVLNEPLLTEGPTFQELIKTSGVSEGVTHNFVRAAQEHTGKIEELWKYLAEGGYGIKPDEAMKLKFSVQAGSLSMGHLPMANSIMQLKNTQRISDIRDLVNWGKDKWIDYLKERETTIPDIIPEGVPGKTPSEKRSAYALAVSRILEQTYPTESLAAKIEADDNADLRLFPTFLSSNASFKIGETNIDAYLKENEHALTGIQEPEAFIRGLKKLQLQYMLSPGYDRYESIKVLQSLNLGSSTDVVGRGWRQFSIEYMENGGSPEMAGLIFEMASHNVAMMQNIVFTYGVGHSLEPYVTAIQEYYNFFTAIMNADPNLRTLFGLQDFCECRHCRSIYGPAAYMVDILQFLKNSPTNTSASTRLDTCLKVLFDRRPDLCHIDLNCKNTNIALPYIDLINEVFENAVYQEHTGTRINDSEYQGYQTTGTTDELLAHPEHIRDTVYNNPLKTAIYPWTLPFDLWTEQGRVYLEHLKLPRYKIMDAFLRAGGYAYLNNEAAVNEILGLSAADREIILGTTTASNQAQWGLETTVSLVSFLNTPQNLFKHSGLACPDLKELLKTWFINPEATIEVEFDEEHECDLEWARINNIIGPILMNILRFIRLKNKLGWSIRELDMALKAFGATSITEDILLKLSHICRLKEYSKAPLDQILAFWGNIFTGHPNDEENERSPYELLFLNKAVINPVDHDFDLNASLEELANTGLSISDHRAAIKAGLSISSADLDTLIDTLTGERLLDDTLNLANLSTLYRHVILAKALRITIDEFLSLKKFASVDPFDPAHTVDPFDPAHTENTIIFIRNYQKIKESRFKISELEYLLLEHYDVSQGIGLSEDTICNILTDIHMGLKKIWDENQFTADPKGEITVGKLATLLSEEDLNTTIGILEQSSLLDEVHQTDFVTTTLGLFLHDTAEAVIRLVNPSTLTTDKQSRYEYILRDLLNYLKDIGMKEFLKGKIASYLNLDTDVADALLFNRIRITGSDGISRFSGDMLLDDNFISIENEDIENPEFREQSEFRELFINLFNTYILLHKTALILRKFKVTSAEVDYLFAGAFDPSPAGWPGWFSFNEFPVIAEDRRSDLFAQLLRLCDLFSFYHGLPASDKKLFEVMRDAFNPASSTTLPQLLETISEMCKWELEDLIELSNNVFGFITKDSYQDEIPFVRLKKCMDILKLSGTTASDMNTWAGAELDSDTSGRIVHSVKSLYSEKEWMGIARPLRNQLRERQRSALTDWLIHHNELEIENMFELYSYYLVDPEMSACMLTSRIRLALSSIQLFVQRCLMNLEKAVKIGNDDLEHWNQWKWMKTYRFWEANRKIFCYPENWTKPGLRDNKTAFFKELEQELEQSEVSDESVERAYINYLSKLEAVSNMDMMGICRAEEREGAGADAYYIFGRTVGKPSILYFRKYQTDKTWTSWERIDIDFEGEHLVPIVYNNKLYIFWPVFTTQTQEAEIPDDEEGAGEAGEPSKYREIQIAWSVYTNGKWSAKRVTEEKINEVDTARYDGSQKQYDYGTKRYFIIASKPSLKYLEVYIYTRADNELFDYIGIGRFKFNPSMKVSIESYSDTTYHLTLYDIKKCNINNQEYIKSDNSPSGALEIPTKIFEKTPSDFFSVTFAYRPIEDFPFLYQDNDRTFFIKRNEDDASFKYNIYNHYHPYVSDFMNVINADGVEGLLDPKYDASDSEALSNKLIRQRARDEEFFVRIYGDRTGAIQGDLPVEEIDFSHEGAYAVYNWELFFHIPMLIAEKLSLNQKFEEAQKWYHYIFDPTNTSAEYDIPKCFWKLRRFMKVYDETEDGMPASILELMKLLNEGDDAMEAQVNAWREDPFNPHLIARMRITAYQRNVVMKYIDNLLSWADMLFRQDTMETTNEATQLYMLAWYILGERPKIVPGKEPEDRTYCELQRAEIDEFSNAMVTLETRLIKYFGNKYNAGFNKFMSYMLAPFKNYEDETLYGANKLWVSKPPAIEPGGEMNDMMVSEDAGAAAGVNRPDRVDAGEGAETNTYSAYKDLQLSYTPFGAIENLAPKGHWSGDLLITHDSYDNIPIYQIVKTLYFCIPPNDVLLNYWDIVEDRMFKLRHCMNIEGVIRQLPLFEPPIEPGELVKARAMGMDFSSALNDLNASLPNYRFTFMIEKAKEFTNIVKNAGGLLLSALEKKDAEALALLRTRNEITLLEAISQIKELQLEEAEQNTNALKESLRMAEDKYTEYASRERCSAAEWAQIGLMSAGILLQLISQGINLFGGSSYSMPEIEVGFSGIYGTPVSTVTISGQQAGNVATSVARGLNDLAGTVYQGASLTGIVASIQRREEDWDHLRDQAEIEKAMIQCQIEAAEIRYKIAGKEIENHEKQIEQRDAEYEYMKSKFTNQDLYDWMTGQISSLYFQAYQMAFDLAKRAERSYKYELADSKDSFISYGYWDSLKKGLLAGEKLQNDLMRMESAYLEKNKRTYEISKHVSLCMLDPFALMQLRENGSCSFDMPEEIFDLDHPGHYMRRIKSVLMTIPCVAGPYSGVNAKLTLLSNSIRKNTEVPGSYPKNPDSPDDRFIDNLAMIQSIATSGAQNDSGLFALDFRDERYLPFEGAGVISSWRLELPDTFRSFDYNTISDVIITLKYTAKDGGEILKKGAVDYLSSYIQSSAEAPLERLFSMKNEFNNEWYHFLNPAGDAHGQQLDISLKKSHFPYMFSKHIIHVTTIDMILQLKNPDLYSNTLSIYLTVPASDERLEAVLTSSTDYLNSQPVLLNRDAPISIEEDEVHITLEVFERGVEGDEIIPGSLETIPEDLTRELNGHLRLNTDQIEDLFLIVHYYTERES